MRRLVLLICALILAVPAGARAQSRATRPAQLTGPVADELRQLVNQLLAARSSRQIQSVAANYPGQGNTPFFDLTFNARGPAEHVRALGGLFDRFASLTLVPFGTSDVGRTGGVAWAASMVRGSGTLKTGRPVTFEARHTALWAGQPGAWRIVHEHFSVPSTTLLGDDDAAQATLVPEDDAAIRAVFARYTEAWNGADAAALSALWDGKGDVGSLPSGTTTVGREAIAGLWAQVMSRRTQQKSATRIAAQVNGVRALAPGVASVDGAFEYRGQNGALTAQERFTFVVARRGDEWKIVTARVAPAPAAR